jgi:putative ABC transport system permease protein
MENYTFNYVFMTKDLYSNAGFDESAADNVMYIRMSDTESQDVLSEKLVVRDDVLAVTYAANGMDRFRNLVSSLSAIVVVIIVFAGALAFVVMFNLTNINVNERIHELATIKVLGFFDGEVASYVYRENTISSLMGGAVGLIVGVWFEKFVIRTCEVDAVMFAPDIPAYCFFAAGGLTIFFALLVNVLLYFRLKKINMAESLKAIE